MRKKYFITYTLLFLAIAACVFYSFWGTGVGFVWRKDGMSQHYNALVYFGKWGRSILSTGKVPLWDSAIGHGADILTTLHYYVVGDPLNLLSILVPERYTEYLYCGLVILRLYLAGLAFSGFCFCRGKGQMATLAGSFSYVFCGYALQVLCKHPFFLNPLIYLPLLCIGVERICQRKKPALFMLSVCLSAVSNFYFFYMLAFAVVFYVVARYISLRDKKSIREFLRLIGRFFGYALVGVMMAAVILLPVILLFLNTYRSDIEQITPFFYSRSYYKSLIPGFLKVTSLGSYTILGFTLPALLAVILLFLQRKKYGVLKGSFLIMTAMYLVPAMGKMMNGFSYVSNRWGFMYAGLVSYILVTMWPEFVSIPVIRKKGAEKKQWMQMGILVLLFVNILYNAYYRYGVNGKNSVSECMPLGTCYSKLEKTAAFAMKEIAESENSFSRYETDNAKPKNAGAIAGVPGVETFWSLVPGTKSQYFFEMANTQRFSYMFDNNSQRTFLNALSNVGYYVQKNEKSAMPYGYEKVGGERVNGYYIYKNRYTLPLGYTSDSYIERDTYDKQNALERQETLMQGVLLEDTTQLPAGIQKAKPEYTAKQISYTIGETDGVSVDLEKGIFQVTKKKGKMTLIFEGIPNSETYVMIKGMKVQTNKKYWSLKAQMFEVAFSTEGCEQSLRCYTPYYTRPSGQTDFVIHMGYRERPLTKVTVTFQSKGHGTMDELAVYCQPMEHYEEQVAKLREDVLEHETFGTNTIRGTIDLKQDKILCLTVPYDKGWTAYVDGEKTTLLQANTMYMALPLQAGSHTVELRYETYGLKAGMLISLIGVVCFVLIFPSDRKHHKAEPDHSQIPEGQSPESQPSH